MNLKVKVRFITACLATSPVTNSSLRQQTRPSTYYDNAPVPASFSHTARQNIVSYLRNIPIQSQRSHSGKTRRHYNRELRICYNNF